MKVVKPLKLGVLHRTFELQGRCFWSPAVMAFFSFDGPPRVLSEIDMWTFCAAQLGKEGILDQGMPKERGEVLVTGAFHSPDGNPRPAGRVRLAMGTVDKSLYVFGQRYWKRDPLVWSITDPVPMASMPIIYANAFGGPEYPFNPLGKGLPVEAVEQTAVLEPLPTVENPACLIGSRRDRPQPACFGPLDMSWQQRFVKSGTYNDQWYQERFPGLADDIDWTFFNTAPEDQQIEGFFNGDESFSIECMHPLKPLIEGRLPALRPRCFVTQSKDQQPAFTEINLHLDTVWLFPHALKGVLVYHGLVEVQHDMAKDIEHLLLAYEFQKEPPRSLMHYHDALTRRLDKEKGAMSMLNESDLIGANERSGFAEMLASEAMADMKGEGLLQKKQKQRMQKDLVAVRAMIAEQGLDPDQMMPLPVQDDKNLNGLDPENLDFDQILSDADHHRQEAEALLEAQLKTLGLTKAEMLEKSVTEPAPRPAFSAAQAIAAYNAMGIQDPDLEKKMTLMETQFRKSYRQAGHALPPVLTPKPELLGEKQQLLLDAYHAGESLHDADLAGLDLSGLNLEGIDLRGALLEDANLAGACLRNANLEGVALMRTDLSGADLSFANLRDAGLGKTVLSNARLFKATLAGASLVGADLRGALFQEADLQEVDLSEAKALKADFSRAGMRQSRFLEADFSQALFVDTDLTKALFYKTNLAGADFSRAVLAEAVLVQATADGCIFRDADLNNLRAAFQCSLAGVDFTRATLCGCNFRGADLSSACFAGADISGSDFSETRLIRCDFTRAKAKRVLFIEADLTEANLRAADLFESLLHKATLHGTHFIGANLYGVDFMKARFHNTDVTLALTDKSTLNRWVPR